MQRQKPKIKSLRLKKRVKNFKIRLKSSLTFPWKKQTRRKTRKILRQAKQSWTFPHFFLNTLQSFLRKSSICSALRRFWDFSAQPDSKWFLSQTSDHVHSFKKHLDESRKSSIDEQRRKSSCFPLWHKIDLIEKKNYSNSRTLFVLINHTRKNQ